MKTSRLSLYVFIIALTFSFSQRGQAQTYVVDSIAYQPYSFTAGRPMLIRLDDTYSQILPLGFSFNFFGTNYTQLIAGSNGNLCFDTTNAGGYDPWPLDGNALPASNVPFNSIFAAYRDIDNTNIGNITYQLLGTAPNRVFIVSYDSVPLYGAPHSVNNSTCHDSSLSVFQVVLYEGCNTIEVYIHHSPSDSAWNSGRGIVGIVNSPGTLGYAAPGRDDVRWTANDEAWRFSLVGSSTCVRSTGGPDQTLCLNHVATMQAIGAGVWSASGSNPTTLVIDSPSSPGTNVSGFSTAGSYALTWSTAIDTSTITITVVACSDSVWPGDADHNGLVDNDDLLPIGLAYDSTGPARAAVSIVWQADAGTSWTDSFTNYTPAVNFKHADCNGDGIVDSTDENAIYQNFSFLHAKTNGPGPSRTGAPMLYAVPSRDTLHAGDILTVDFVLADAQLPINGFYGLAFTYNFDPMVVDSAFTGMAYNNSWIGSTDKISFSKVIAATGEIKTAVTRIDHTSRSGYGTIGSATFKVSANVQAGTLYTNAGYISNITTVDPTGRPIPVNAGTDSTVIASPSGITELSTLSVSIRPNPAHDRVMISTANAIKEVSITNVMGQEVIHSYPNTNTANIDLSAFTSGLYFVHVSTARGTGISKLTVEK